MKTKKKEGSLNGGGQHGAMQDLWPDLSRMEPSRTPILVLKEQAALLGQKTKNIVTAAVLGPSRGVVTPDEEEDFKDGFALISFVLVAPVLENYHYHLFNIQYSIAKPYPIRIFAHTQPPLVKKVNSEKELTEALKAIFSNQATVSAISAMVSQSMEMTPTPVPSGSADY